MHLFEPAALTVMMTLQYFPFATDPRDKQPNSTFLFWLPPLWPAL